MSVRECEETNTMCQICKGSGLMKVIPFTCKRCENMPYENCMYCQNVNKSNYDECIHCLGRGYINSKNQKK